MFDAIAQLFQGLTQNGGSVYTSSSSNGFGLDVILKDIFGNTQAIYPNQNPIDAQNIINQLLGR